MPSGSPFTRHLLLHLRTSAIIVSVVALGLWMYATMHEEEVNWTVVLLVAAAMLGSTILNTLYDVWKERKAARRP
ncbi:MAG TPA: hypothetical protein VHI13_01875 [Candidatus Kapabacteria bacterium]|nr:hypothetical protein [Candidatus Kapabacteria bacterium]